MVRTTASLAYGDMREKVQKVLSDSCGKDSGGVPVKEKDCDCTNWKGYYKKGGSNKKGNNFEKSKIKLEANPVDSDGNMRCQQNILHQAVLMERLKKPIWLCILL